MTQNYAHIRSVDDLKRLVDRMMSVDTPFGFDIESGYEGPFRDKGSLQPHAGAFVVGMSISGDPKWGRYIPLRHDFGPNLDPDEVYGVLEPLLMSGRAVCHQVKFERRMLRTDGADLRAKGDTLLQAYVLQYWPTLGLKDLVKAVFDHDMVHIENLFPGAKDIRFNAADVTPETVAYACEDAAWCLALHQRLEPKVLKERSNIYRLELEISDLLVEMEDWGVEVDWDLVEKMAAESEGFASRMEAEVKAQLAALAGRSLATLNLGSPKQMRELLYKELGMKTNVTTAKGTLSTGAIALTRLAKDHPEVKKLLELREVQHLVRRFAVWLDRDRKKARTRGIDGRVHSNYSQTAVGSGRFSASDPAIQQLPKELHWELSDGTTFAFNFRDLISSAPESYLLSFDFSQIELRVMAGLAQEPALLEAFERDEDVHTLTAALMFGKPKDRVSKDDRDVGKRMNFALLYRMGPSSLADRLGVTKERGQQLYQEYFAAYPQVLRWTERMVREGKERGYAMTPFGRRYTVWELQSDSHALAAKGERVLVNTPVQGGAADYTKIAMLRSRRVLEKQGWWGTQVRLIMNQHDALTFEVSADLDPREVIKVIRPAVEFPVPGLPKMASEWETGKRWGTAFSARTGELRQPEGAFPIDEDSDLRLIGDFWVPVQQVPAMKDENPFEESPEVDEVVEIPETPVPEQEAEGQVFIECPEMPTAEQFRRLVALLSSVPGALVPVFRTPEGEVVGEGLRTGLGPSEASRVAVAVPGARVVLPESEVSAELVSGLNL